MNFDFSDDQKMLQEQVRRFLADKCPPKTVRRVLEGEETHAEEVWRGLVEMGLTGAAIPEEFGGLGLGALELCVVAEELGRACAPVPFSSSVYLASEAIKKAGSAAQKKKYLPLLASGQIIGTLATSEGPNAASPRTVRAKFANGSLSGAKTPVVDGEAADIAVVLANTGGEGERALSLALVELKGKGVSRSRAHTIDPARKHAQIAFDGAPAELLGGEGEGWKLLQDIYDGAAVLFAFEQIGGSEAALTMARDYALQRYAFGRQIGSYQAIKHKLADVYVKKELARSNAYYGAMMLAEGGADLPVAAAASRVAATDAYDFAAAECIQTHGGIGFTWEADTQFHYRRSRVLALNIGGPTVWKEKLVRRLEQQNAA
ncbi:MAG: acyl-CoA dehydrogenase family protein [Reyranellaceae bacterium]